MERELNREKGWILVKLLIAITASLILVYFVTSQIQGLTFKARDLATKANLNFLRLSLFSFYRDNKYWPNDLRRLIPRYLKKIPREFLSSDRGSSYISNIKTEELFKNSRSPSAKGWIYGAYDGEDKKFARKILPMSSTPSDKSRGRESTLNW